MTRTALVAVVLVATAGRAHADPAVDAAAEFRRFVNTLSTTDLELFEAPFAITGVVPDADELAAIHAMTPRAAAIQVHLSATRTSAWLTALIPAVFVHRDGTSAAEPLRASAFLDSDHIGWHVRATQWSAAEPDRSTPGCGLADLEWDVVPGVPTALAPIVTPVLEALAVDAKAWVALMSDDPRSVVFGSAREEVFVGGAAIKASFKNWHVGGPRPRPDQPTHARANISSDGTLLWIAAPVYAPAGMCTAYRGFFVLAKEAGGWRLVHQHYADRILR